MSSRAIRIWVALSGVAGVAMLIAESAWVLAAAGALVISRRPASGAAAACQPLPQGTGSRTSASRPQ